MAVEKVIGEVSRSKKADLRRPPPSALPFHIPSFKMREKKKRRWLCRQTIAQKPTLKIEELEP